MFGEVFTYCGDFFFIKFRSNVVIISFFDSSSIIILQVFNPKLHYFFTGMDPVTDVDINSSETKTNQAEDVIPLSDGTIKEGKAVILKETSKHVFYNPVQEFNRDLRCGFLFILRFCSCCCLRGVVKQNSLNCSILVLSVHAEDHFKQKQVKKSKEKKRNPASEENNKTEESSDTVEPIPDLEPGNVYEVCVMNNFFYLIKIEL